MSDCMKEITVTDEEFDRVLKELLENRKALQKAQQLSEDSFRFWLLETIRDIASKMGLVVNGLKEFVFDFSYAAKTGWHEGAEMARQNSYRESDRRKK